MEAQLKKQLEDWLSTPVKNRDVATGAMLTRRITRNTILANNYEKFPNRFGKMVEYQLSKFAVVRVKENADHEMVEKMAKQAEEISKRNGLDKKLPGLENWKEPTRILKTERFAKGKREDHDSLPEDIQALYTENVSIMQQMRHNRAQLLVIMNTKDNTVCPDGDRYPFVKELIALDDRYLSNWEKYDTYTAPE